MRAADADRQAVAERLRVALDEGRLDLHEYDERLQRAYGARTYAELDALVSDLPVPGGAVLPVPGGAVLPTPRQPSVPVPAEAGRGPTARWLAEVWEPWLKVVGIVVAIWAISSLAAGEVLYFWPGWVAGPWGAVVMVRTVTGLTSGEPARWAAERERRRQRKAEKRALKREREAVDQQQPGIAGAPESGAAAHGVTEAAPAAESGRTEGGRPTGDAAGAPVIEPTRRPNRGDVG
ncbi:DUF1707 domain-containing protein [Micromonospora sp. C95]|nr:DUF1707 domain-containing protein [Micromonospora sp. C95]